MALITRRLCASGPDLVTVAYVFDDATMLLIGIQTTNRTRRDAFLEIDLPASPTWNIRIPAQTRGMREFSPDREVRMIRADRASGTRYARFPLATRFSGPTRE